MSTAPRSLVGAITLVAVLGLSARADEPDEKARPSKLYDAKADARVQLDAAVRRAKRDNSRVLVMFGFEGCGWCHKLHNLFVKDAAVRKALRDDYIFVAIEKSGPNAAELLKECKAALADEGKRGIGYPFLAVYDGNGKVVTAQRTEPLEEGDGHDPDRAKAFLAKWVAPRVDAKTVLSDALARAEKADKRVLLHFGAPWCGWCHRLEDFLARPEIEAIIAADYLDVKIDIDRMENGKEVKADYCQKEGGIPWFVILDAQGKALATSDGPAGNVGFPYEPREVEHFLSLLKQTSRKMEPAQLGAIKAALEKTRADIERERKR